MILHHKLPLGFSTSPVWLVLEVGFPWLLSPVVCGCCQVGIPGPGAHPLLWRRAWRDKVLPALVNFKPDLILVSAGFDAHRKDEINFR